MFLASPNFGSFSAGYNRWLPKKKARQSVLWAIVLVSYKVSVAGLRVRPLTTCAAVSFAAREITWLRSSSEIACLGLRPRFLCARNAIPSFFIPPLRRLIWRSPRPGSCAACGTINLPAKTCFMTYTFLASFRFEKMFPFFMATFSQTACRVAVSQTDRIFGHLFLDYSMSFH